MKTSTYALVAVAFFPILAGLASATPARPQPSLAPEQLYQLALEARTARDYRDMVRLLHKAGFAGHLQAQELLASVLLIGPSLYGHAVKAAPCEAAHWMMAAMAQGSEIAFHHHLVLNGMREVRDGWGECTPLPPALERNNAQGTRP